MMQQNIVVIGAGIIGAPIAFRLQKSGHKVTLIDKGAPGHGASFGNAAALAVAEVIPTAVPGLLPKIPGWLLDVDGPLSLAPSHLPAMLPWLLLFMRNCTRVRAVKAAEAMVQLGLRASSDTANWMSDIALKDCLVQNDMLRAYGTEKSFKDDAFKLDLKKRLGFVSDVLSGDEIAELEPALRPPYARGLLVRGAHRMQSSIRPIEQSVAMFEKLGGRFRRAEVRALSRSADMKPQVHLADGTTLTPDQLVVACGVWSAQIARGVGDRFVIESERGYHYHIPNVQTSLSRTVIDMERSVGVAPLEDGTRFTGIVEFAGIDAPPNYKRARIMERHARTILGEAFDPTHARDWMGHRPVMPNGLPVIGRSRRCPSVTYAFGHGHMGLTLAATTAILVEDVLNGHSSQIDLSPFEPTNHPGG